MSDIDAITDDEDLLVILAEGLRTAVHQHQDQRARRILATIRDLVAILELNHHSSNTAGGIVKCNGWPDAEAVRSLLNH